MEEVNHITAERIEDLPPIVVPAEVTVDEEAISEFCFREMDAVRNKCTALDQYRRQIKKLSNIEDPEEAISQIREFLKTADQGFINDVDFIDCTMYLHVKDLEEEARAKLAGASQNK